MLLMSMGNQSFVTNIKEPCASRINMTLKVRLVYNVPVCLSSLVLNLCGPSYCRNALMMHFVCPNPCALQDMQTVRIMKTGKFSLIQNTPHSSTQYINLNPEILS